jgi:hypothetical protein
LFNVLKQAQYGQSVNLIFPAIWNDPEKKHPRHIWYVNDAAGLADVVVARFGRAKAGEAQWASPDRDARSGRPRHCVSRE